MNLSTIVGDIATGSATATPSFGSATADALTKLPSTLINYFAGLLKTLGS